MRYKVVIINADAQNKAFEANRSAYPDEALRAVYVTANGISGINGQIQDMMGQLGFVRNAWKVLSHTDASNDPADQ